MNKKKGVPRKPHTINLKIYQKTLDRIINIQKEMIKLSGLSMIKTDIIETAIFLLEGLTPEKIIKEFINFKKDVDQSTLIRYDNPEN